APPPHRANFHKRLEKLGQGPEGVMLHFKDAQNTVADVVISADGIQGHTRDSIIGLEVAEVRFSGSIVDRGLALVECAVEVLGEVSAYSCVITLVNGGNSLDIVAFYTANDLTDENWLAPARYEGFMEKYRGRENLPREFSK
ncbi:MAG: hypothetical protein Q9211_006453, partial [Gyalolechia sp. 1 TL-2023]